MYKKLLFTFCIFLILSCKEANIEKTSPETFYSKISESNLEKVQKGLIKELYSFYLNSNKTSKFYEAIWAESLVINYNQENKTLNVSIDACSGWLFRFKNVEEKDIKFLSDNEVIFNNYKNYIQPLGDTLSGVNIPTNARCLSTGK
jgi:hypothetical protein